MNRPRASPPALGQGETIGCRQGLNAKKRLALASWLRNYGLLWAGAFMKHAIVGLAAAALCVAGPVIAQEFPPKPDVLKQIAVSPIGEMIFRESEPRRKTRTVTTRSYHGSITTTDRTIEDSGYAQPPQYLRVNNGSSYDIQNVVVECHYLGASGVVLAVKSQLMPYRFNTAQIRTVDLYEPPPVGEDAREISCLATEFEYIRTGTPPKPNNPDAAAHDRSGASVFSGGSGRPLVDEWGPRKGR
ncbi:hypothetical protein ACVWYH_008178 [Bradyrhizobium sp. GM24.11]